MLSGIFFSNRSFGSHYVEMSVKYFFIVYNCTNSKYFQHSKSPQQNASHQLQDTINKIKLYILKKKKKHINKSKNGKSILCGYILSSSLHFNHYILFGTKKFVEIYFMGFCVVMIFSCD